MNEYIKSAAITFFATFAIFLLANMDGITQASFTDGTLVAIVFVAVRTGIKALLESFVLWYNTDYKKNSKIDEDTTEY